MCSVGLAVGSSFIAAVRARASYHSSGSVFAGSIVGSVFAGKCEAGGCV